jgi:2-dehydropantoate 2-reductase
LLGLETAVLFAMNGVPWWYFHAHTGPHVDRRLTSIDPGDAIWQAIGPARAIGGGVYSSFEVAAPGEINVDSATSRLVLGEPDGQMTERLARIAAAMRSSGMMADETADIRTALWTKLLMNLSSGPLAVLTSSAPKDYLTDPACEVAIRALYAEGMTVAAAFGCAPVVDIERALGFSRKITHRPSILQDLYLGQPMEIDGIYGATLELARLAGVATPMLDLLVALTRLRARAAGLY